MSQPTSIDVIGDALMSVAPGAGWRTSPDGALTVMLSDIADAEAVAGQLGPERWEQLLSDQRLLVERLIAHHDGAVVKFERDGFLATFNSAHGGVYAGLELQRTFSAGDAAGSVALRVGLHSGFVIGNPGEPLGRNVVLAARIASFAKGGEVLVSSALKGYTETDRGLTFESRGEHHFKGLHGEHEVFLVSPV